MEKVWVDIVCIAAKQIEQLILTGRGFMFTRMCVRAYNTHKSFRQKIANRLFWIEAGSVGSPMYIYTCTHMHTDMKKWECLRISYTKAINMKSSTTSTAHAIPRKTSYT